MRPFRINLLYFLSFLILFVLVRCSATKSVPQGDALYMGATVKLEAPDTLDKTRKKVVQSALGGLARPKPNGRFLGIPFKLLIYNFFNAGTDSGFFARLGRKFGEPPVLLSSVNLEDNTKRMTSYLENKGFFRATVTGDTSVKKKKASATYTAVSGQQYTIASVAYPDDTSELSRTIRESVNNSLLTAGAPFDLTLIEGERLRIDAYLKERGFYFFSPGLLLAQVDSSDENGRVDMRMVLKPETPDAARRIFRIGDVYIYSNYSLNTAADDTSKVGAIQYKGYTVVDPDRKFRPLLFETAMQFDSGDVYNRRDHNSSLSRLINLNVFKFVKNRFEPAPSLDTPRLDAYYYLTPLPKKSLRAEFGLNTKSNNLNGSVVTVGFSNRNTFRAGELFSLQAYAGTEVQVGGNLKGYNVYRTGAEANFTIPRFIVPFIDFRTQGDYVPRTNIQIGYDLLNRRRLYTLNSYRAGLGYLWKRTTEKQHEFYPISLNYVQPLNVSDEYRDSVRRYPYLQRVVDSQFIIGSNYQYNWDSRAAGLQRTNEFFFNGLVDLSGGLAGLVVGGKENAKNPTRINNAVFDQYIKLEADGRYYKRLGLNTTWANRVVVGYGLPYGNSYSLPYIKQFFSGGNNSIRAFRSRSLLGAYNFPDSTGFFPDQTGDMRMEFNTEFRPHISGPLYGAVFLDAGNTWLRYRDSTRPGAEFSKDFLKEIAVGAGVGIRIDIQFVVLRLDAAFPLRKPWESNPPGRTRIELGNKEFRRQNVVMNLAIGYPF